MICFSYCSNYLSVCFIHPCIRSSLRLSLGPSQPTSHPHKPIHPRIPDPSIHSFIHPFIHLSFILFTLPLPIYMHVELPSYLFTSLSFHLCICLLFPYVTCTISFFSACLTTDKYYMCFQIDDIRFKLADWNFKTFIFILVLLIYLFMLIFSHICFRPVKCLFMTKENTVTTTDI